MPAAEKRIFRGSETSFMAGTDQSVLSYRDLSHVLHLKMPGRKKKCVELANVNKRSVCAGAGVSGCTSTVVRTDCVTECASFPVCMCMQVWVCVRNMNLLVNVKKLAV